MAEVWIVNRSYVSNIRRASANPDTLWGEWIQWKLSKQLLQYQFHCFMNRIGDAEAWPRRLVAGGRRVLSLRNPWARLRGSWCTAASRGPHRDPDLQGGGSRDSLQLQSVCSHCSHQSHARLMLVFCSAGFTILQRCSVAAGRRCLVCMQQLTAATPSCHSCSTVGTKTILTITTLLFIGRYVFHFAQATARTGVQIDKKIQYV